MKIILATDHRGFQLKEFIKANLLSEGFEVIDVGAITLDPTDDYVDYAVKAVNPEVLNTNIAILFCGSGHGMDITANRYSHVRAILGFNESVAKQGRNDEDANVLIIPSDWLQPEQAYNVVNSFLNTPFSNEERHLRRLSKLNQL